MKKSSPISLFSFQDIITCLTGIMIVVVLVILQQQVEATATATASLSQLPEYQNMKKKEKELEKIKKQLEESVAIAEKEADSFSSMSIEEVKNLIHEEDLYANALRKEKNQLQAQLNELLTEIKRISDVLESTKKQIRDLAEDENKILELQAQLSALEQRKKKTEDKIEEKKKVLRFEFVGVNDKIPLLIECNQWGFRCKRHPDGKIVKQGSPGQTLLSGELSQLEKWLAKQDMTKCYPVLLFREKSIPYYVDIMEILYKFDKELMIGKELVGSSEECFYE